MTAVHDTLVGKALLALEEAVQECRYHAPRRTFAIRFALAYLWASGANDRRAFDDLWKQLASPERMWRFGAADQGLGRIYRELGLERDNDVSMRVWERVYREFGRGKSAKASEQEAVDPPPT